MNYGEQAHCCARKGIMTVFFLLVCAISVVFFTIFFVGCSLSMKKPNRNQKSLSVRKLPQTQVVDSACGRRFFVHLEKQMDDFLAAHTRSAAILLVALAVTSVIAKAQSQDPASSTPQSAASDPSIPPAVAKQLEAMQKRIDQLEQELQSRAAQPPTADGAITTPPHSVVEQASPPVDSQSALAEKAKPSKPEPFAFADFSWLNGNSRVKDIPFQNSFFTPEIRADVDYVYDFNHPQDDTISGSSEIFRANEFQVTQLGVGGDFHYDNVIARLMTQFGMYSTTTPRNDASPGRGQWQLADAYRYVSEAYGGYHFNVLDGVNVQAGIFMSYIGLFSYYNFDNWAYQPSYVSSNTPWFFNGMRTQIFINQHLKIEPWLINGWQSYGRFNNRPGVGGQILWRPNGWFSLSATSTPWARTPWEFPTVFVITPTTAFR